MEKVVTLDGKITSTPDCCMQACSAPMLDEHNGKIGCLEQNSKDMLLEFTQSNIANTKELVDSLNSNFAKQIYLTTDSLSDFIWKLRTDMEGMIHALAQDIAGLAQNASAAPPPPSSGDPPSSRSSTTSVNRVAQSEKPVTLEVESESSPSSSLAFSIRDYVRLRGLNSTHLNNAVGEITRPLQSNKRYPVVLHGSSLPVVVKAENLLLYSPRSTDFSPRCNCNISMYAFPSCSCPYPKTDAKCGTSNTTTESLDSV